MTKYTFISIFVLLAGCTQRHNDANNTISSASASKTEMRTYCDTLNDKATICCFNEQENSDWILSVYNGSGILLIDTLGNSGGIDQQIDFNEDGYLDIIVYEMGGNHGRFYLYLWNNFSREYESVEGYNYCNNSKKLKNEGNYYFSFDWAGCCLQHSYLFTIEDYNVIPIAHLSVTTESHKVELSKCSQFGWQNDKLVETWILDSSTTSIEEFVENFWKANGKTFII